MFMVFAGILSLSATVLLLYPFVRRDLHTASHTEHIKAIFREQLDELDREHSRGLLTEKQVAVSRAEIERRLGQVEVSTEDFGSGIGTIGRTFVAAAITLGLTVGAVSLYFFLGMPGQPDRPLAQRTDELRFAEQAHQLDEYSKTLAARLEKDPGDAEGWAVLGRLHRAFGRFTESADAFARVHELRPDAARAAVDHAEALVHVAQGTVSRKAENMFAAALAADPQNVKARFYMGAALARRPDDIAEAIEIWRDLERDSPPDAPWLEMLRQNIRLAMADLEAITESRRAVDAKSDGASSGGEE